LNAKFGVVGIGQQEVYDFLTHHKGKWFTSRDVSEQLNVSIGSVTMSLKKLRKTNLIKFKNTGVRNTFIYTVEPEGVTVLPPPGIIEAVKQEEERKPPKTEKILPKVVMPRRSVPLVVRREPEPAAKPAKRKAAKKAVKKAKPKKAKRVRPKRTVRKVARKTVKKAKPKKAKRVKRAAKRATRRAKRAVKKAGKKTKPKKTPEMPKRGGERGFLRRLLRR